MVSEHSHEHMASGGSRPNAGSSRHWLRLAARSALALFVLGIGGAVSFYWLTHRPKAKRHKPKAEAKLVEVSSAAMADEPVTVKLMGTVVPAKTVALASQVGGEIVEISPSFVPGGRFRADERIARIERADYELVVRQRTAELAKAESELKLEMGQQDVAKRESELLGADLGKEDKELLLRGPQLAAAQASVAMARAALEKARLDLERTTIEAPFNAIVQSRNVDIGSQVNARAALASLVCTDEYWVQVSVPVNQLRWIDIPGANSSTGSAVRVYHEAAWGEKKARLGTVKALMTNIETEGRMAMLLVSVKDPLNLDTDVPKDCPLILDAYVRVEINGRQLRNVVRIPRTALRDGNRVWVMNSDGTLDIREVAIEWSSDDYVCLSGGLVSGDLVVTSDLAAPVQGMALRTLKALPNASAGHAESRTVACERKETPS